MEELIKDLVLQLKKLDCGDNSCLFSQNRTGMLTNGGCRCLTTLPQGLRIAITRVWYQANDKKEQEIS
ncbi:MAG: hypothetical protein WC279_15050 [Sulfurimonas sp.]|jgi:hypothetical protein